MFKPDIYPAYLVLIASCLIGVLILYMILSALVIGRQQRAKHRQYLQALLKDREATMHSIAHEVHDNICQMLTTQKLYRKAIGDALPQALQNDFADSNRILDQILEDARDISHTLNPFYLQHQKLVPALEEKLRLLNNSRKLSCSLHLQGSVYHLHADTELITFRIAQEALNNIVKHAEAENISISLLFFDKELTMIILDDGKGYNAHRPDFKEGSGIMNMRQRADLIQGSLAISSQEQEGTRVVLKVPVKNKKHLPPERNELDNKEAE